MCIRAGTANRLSGIHDRFDKAAAPPTSRENKKDQGRGPKVECFLLDNSKEAIPIPGKTKRSDAGSASGSTVLPQSPNCPGHSPNSGSSGLFSVHRSHSDHEGGTAVVGEPPLTMEWQNSGNRETLSDHRDRCIKTGLGATSQGVQTGGPWSTPESNNCLEALAAFLEIKCFIWDRRSVTVRLRMDNMSAITYINKLGGTAIRNMLSLLSIRKPAVQPSVSQDSRPRTQ